MYGFLMLALFFCEVYSVGSKAVKKKTVDLGSRGQSSTIALSALILGIARSNPTCSIRQLSLGVQCFCVYHYVMLPAVSKVCCGCHFNHLKTESNMYMKFHLYLTKNISVSIRRNVRSLSVGTRSLFNVRIVWYV